MTDSLGELEKASVVLHAPAPEPESRSLVLARLQARSDEAALRIEDLFAELLDVERGFLFYGNQFTDVIVNDTRFWEILRKSYNAFYSDYYDSFERFLLLVVGQIKSRQYARQVFETYSKFLAV